MRDIRFRAKRLDDGKWIVGGGVIRCTLPPRGKNPLSEFEKKLPFTQEQVWMFHLDEKNHPTITMVIGDTVGQSTGQYCLPVKGELWEGDIVSIVAEDGRESHFVIRYGIAQRTMDTGWKVDIPCFYFDLVGGNFKAFPIVKNYLGKHDLEMMDKIGNIHDNPELLK